MSVVYASKATASLLRDALLSQAAIASRAGQTAQLEELAQRVYDVILEAEQLGREQIFACIKPRYHVHEPAVCWCGRSHKESDL